MDDVVNTLHGSCRPGDNSDLPQCHTSRRTGEIERGRERGGEKKIERERERERERQRGGEREGGK